MTDKEMLDELKKLNAEALAEQAKGNQEASAKAFAAYDKKMDEYQAAINSRLDKIEVDMKTAAVLPGGKSAEDAKSREALVNFMRRGAREDLVSTGTGTEGGVLVPKTVSAAITEYAQDGNPLRDLANVVTISTDCFEVFDEYGDFGANWVTELATRSVTDNASFGATKIYVHEMNAIPKVTQRAIEDIAFDVEAMVTRGIGRAFAKKENAAFFNGNGVEQATGLMSLEKIADASWARGKSGFITSGSASAITADGMIALQDALADEYSGNATWLMNKSTLTALRQLKAGSGGANQYLLWTPELVNGRLENMFMGSPVRKCTQMPAIEANAYAVAYGDFRQAYTIVDRVGMTILRNPYLLSGFVLFDARKRVGGGVVNSQAYKLLKIAA